MELTSAQFKQGSMTADVERRVLNGNTFYQVTIFEPYYIEQRSKFEAKRDFNTYHEATAFIQRVFDLFKEMQKYEYMPGRKQAIEQELSEIREKTKEVKNEYRRQIQRLCEG